MSWDAARGNTVPAGGPLYSDAMARGRENSPLERLVRDGSDEDVQRFFLLLRHAELADALEIISDEALRMRVIRLMGAELASDVLREVEDEQRDDILEDLSAGEIAEIVQESRSDDAADLIAALPPEKAERTLNKLEDEEREELEELLQYGEETAGGIMQTEVVRAQSDGTVASALQAIRDTDLKDVGEVHEVYVVDAEGRLIGTVSPADLLQEDPSTPLRSVIEPNPVAVPVTMDQEQIAVRVREHNLAALPVVDASGILLGQILHDDIADVIAEEATEDIAKMAGASADEVYDDRIGAAVRVRAAWLTPAFMGALGTTTVMVNADEVLQNHKELLYFLPVILGMAGNVGTQSSALTVRALALKRIEWGKSGKFIKRQILTGVSLGVIFGLALFAIAGFSETEPRLPMAVALSLWTAMSTGAVMGVTVPVLISRFGKDPAIAASPFVQTANDLTGAGILIFVARWILGG